MSKRSISAIIFSIIIFFEIIIFALQPPIETITRTETKTLFGGTTKTINHDAMNTRNMKFLIIIGATIIVGGLVTITLPAKKTEKEG